jgi:hypothetical protein
MAPARVQVQAGDHGGGTCGDCCGRKLIGRSIE